MAAQTGDVIVATVIHDNANSGEQMNRYQFQVSGGAPLSDGDLLDDISDIIEGLYILIEGFISIRNVLREVGVFNMTQDQLVGVTDAGAYVGGAATGDDVPQGACPFVYFKTNIPKVILSKYLPTGIVVQLTQSALLDTGALTAIALYADDLLDAFSEANGLYDYGYLSPKTANFVIPQLAVVRAVLAYQRRRKPGRGS